MQYRILVSLSAVILLSGCSTLMRYTYDDKEACDALPYIYGGTVIDWYFLTGSGQGEFYQGSSIPSRVLGFVDMPFSFLADSVMLPVSIPMQISRSNQQVCDAANSENELNP